MVAAELSWNEGSGVRGLDQRRRVEPAVAAAAGRDRPDRRAGAEAAVGREVGIEPMRRRVAAALDPDVEHAVEAALVERGAVAVAQRAGARHLAVEQLATLHRPGASGRSRR